MDESTYTVLILLGLACIGLLVPLVISARAPLEYSRRTLICPETKEEATLIVGKDPKGKRSMRVSQCSELADGHTCHAGCLGPPDEG